MSVEQRIIETASNPLLVWSEPLIDNEAVCDKIVINNQLIWKECILTGEPNAYINGLFFGSVREIDMGSQKGMFDVRIGMKPLAVVSTIEEGKALLEEKKVGWLRAIILNALEK